ncbi:MAG TPA: tripartite tricarboxylate transporter permease [Limnochordales bacterium]
MSRLENLTHLLQGFSVALQPHNLLAAFAGCLIGTAIGALPGIGPVSGVALLLPLTFGQQPVTAIIMLAGIYYGAMYGGAITSILVNAPGESASVVTALDGYQLARQGRGGLALALSAIGSFVAGTLGVVFLMLLAPTMAEVALRFGPPENFALMVLGLTTVAGLGSGSLAKALISVVLGLMLGTVGIDTISGRDRYTLGMVELLEGIDFVVAAIGVFALGEVLWNLQHPWRDEGALVDYGGFRSLWPSWRDLRATLPAMLRGTLVGFLVGVLPGAGATVSSFLAYTLERRLSRHPERFGRGAPEGVAAPEAANNAATAGAMAPMLVLGIPGSATTGVILAALLMFGLRPGPTLFLHNPDFVWGLFASMYVGNVMLLILNLPLVGLFAQISRVPYRLLTFVILLFSVLGTYGLRNSLFDVGLLFVFGVVGYLFRKADIPAAPMALGLVLAPLLEQAFRQSLIVSRGSYLIFLQRPVSLGVLALAGVLTLGPVVWSKLAGRLRAARPAGMGAPSAGG